MTDPATDPEYAKFLAKLRLREGDRRVVYRDSRGFPTGGTGHRIKPEDKLKVGDAVSKDQDDAWLAADGLDAWTHGVALAAQAGITDRDFLPAIAAVCYQVGNNWTKKFPNTWRMICRRDYEGAAEAIEVSEWDHQTPVRVQDFQAALRALVS